MRRQKQELGKGFNTEGYGDEERTGHGEEIHRERDARGNRGNV